MSGGRRHQDWDSSSKLYIGGLRSDCNKYDLEDTFSKYGKVLNTWVAQRPPGFGFLLYEDAADAADAVRALDGSKFNGYRIKVEMANDVGRGGGGRRGGRSRSRSRRRSPRRRSRSRSRSRSPVRRRSRSPVRRRRSRTPVKRRSRSRRDSRSPIRKRSRSRSR